MQHVVELFRIETVLFDNGFGLQRKGLYDSLGLWMEKGQQLWVTNVDVGGKVIRLQSPLQAFHLASPQFFNFVHAFTKHLHLIPLIV